MNKILLATFLCGVVLMGAGCSKTNWMGFYYPDKSDLTNDVRSGFRMGSLEECRSWVEDQKTKYNPNEVNIDDYECGSNCKYKSDFDGYLCDETIR